MQQYDVLIIGSGLAGLSLALRTAEQFGGEGFGGRTLRRVSRRATASPATGNHHLHEEEQKALLMEAFTR